MALYVGREAETRALLELKKKKRSSLIVVQGRRRIGKTTFVRECGRHFDRLINLEGLAPRPNINAQHQLDVFIEQLSDQSDVPKVTLDGWPAAFQLLANAIPKKGWTLVLLDEISWMAQGDDDFPGHLKLAWDKWLAKQPRLVMVLCGSVSSWIEDNILSSTGFVGRTSWQIVLGPLPLPACNAFWRKKTKIAPVEKIKVLSVTGGVPRYLEEIDPTQDAEQNIHRLCFQSGGLLFREFDQLFADVFERRAQSYRAIVRGLADGPRTVTQISETLGVERGGSLSSALRHLELAGFTASDMSFDLRTGKPAKRAIRHRLSDNYLRFYLRYIEPRRTQIEKGLYKRQSLESLPGWSTIMGLQLENLVHANLDEILRRLGLDAVPILNAGPYHQTKTQRRLGCQIDLLVRTKQSLYVAEIKLRDRIERSVIDEIKEKVSRLKRPAATSIRTALIYQGDLDPNIEMEDYFDAIIPFESLLIGSP